MNWLKDSSTSVSNRLFYRKISPDGYGCFLVFRGGIKGTSVTKVFIAVGCCYLENAHISLQKLT